MSDDDLIFAEDAQAALNKTRPVKPLKRHGHRPPTTSSRSRPPDAATAARPHVLVSPVLAEPLLLSRQKRYTIGRGEDADIRIKTDKVSRQHANIYWNECCFVVEDLGSTNGSALNDRPVVPSKPVPLLDRDRLCFGGFEITVEVLAPGVFPESNLGGPTRRLNRNTES